MKSLKPYSRVLQRSLKIVAGILGLFVVAVLAAPLPDPLFDTPYSTTLRDRNGRLLSAAIADDQQWRFAPADSLPEKFTRALQLYEDEYFSWHPGVNPLSIARAVRQNMHAGKVVSGGSTLTMQTIRMALGNRPRTMTQKTLEVLAALKLELFCSKEEILQAYANHAPFGGNIVGLNAASWRYYKKSPEYLTWAEAATLAILPNDPASIFPGRNQERLKEKRNGLLDKLRSSGYLDEDELFLAKEEPLPSVIHPLPNHAYHLMHRAMNEGQKGEDIRSTLDGNLQVRTTEMVRRYSARQASNEVHNAAAVILDLETGNVLSYVGNSDNPGEHGQHVDIVQARRSPGSLLKPFLYALAIDDGLITPEQLLPDVPLFYNGFAPSNFDKEFRGAVPADEALMSSLNVPFVHLLIDYGYEKFHEKLKRLGMHSLDQPASHYGLSLILGGGETTLCEVTGMYAGMARAMYKYDERPYRSGYSPGDYHANRYVASENEEEALQADGLVRIPSIRFTLEAMKGLNRPDSELGWEQFRSSVPVSWKTGTSYGFRDAWAVGLNDRYVVGVWVGNADGEGRPGLTGVRAAAPLMFDLFTLLDGENELVPEFGMPYSMCRESGMLAGKACKETYTRQLPDYVAATAACHYHQVVHLNKEATNQVNSSCYPVSEIRRESFFILPPSQSWYYKQVHAGYRKLPPFLAGCSQGEEDAMMELIYPRHYGKLRIPKEQAGNDGRVVFEAAHEDRDTKIYWHLDEEFVAITQGTHQQGITAPAGEHRLTLVDDRGNELQVDFEVE